jgi:F0F1-type ATP synthase assembly protein I
MIEKDVVKPEQNQQEPSHFMNLIAEVSTLAWNLVIPIVGGVMLGYYLDNRNASGVTWTLSLLTFGVIIAFSNLYNLYIEQGRNKLKQNKSESEAEEDHVQQE